MRARPAPWLAALLAVGLWGTHAAVADLSVRLSGSLAYTLLAYVASWCACTVGLVVSRSGRSVAAHLTPGVLAALVLSGFALLGYYLAFHYALTLVHSVTAYALHMLWPLFAILFTSAASESCAIRGREWSLLAVAFGGAVVVVADPSMPALGATPLVGYAFALLSAVCGGLYLPALLAASRQLKRRGHGDVTSFLGPYFVVLSVGLVVLAASLVVTGGSAERPATGAWIGAVVTGVGVFLIAEVAWLYGMRDGHRPAIVGLAYWTPGVSVLLLYAVAGARVDTPAIAGIAIIIGATVLIQRVASGPPRA